MPFAVPGVRLGDGAPALHTDRGTRCAFPLSATGGGQARDLKEKAWCGESFSILNFQFSITEALLPFIVFLPQNLKNAKNLAILI